MTQGSNIHTHIAATPVVDIHIHLPRYVGRRVIARLDTARRPETFTVYSLTSSTSTAPTPQSHNNQEPRLH